MNERKYRVKIRTHREGGEEDKLEAMKMEEEKKSSKWKEER